MKKFKCKLSLLIILLTAGVLAFSLAGLVLNVINVIAYFDKPLMVLRYATLGVACLAILILALSIYLFSYYKIKDASLIKRSGIFVEKINLQKVVSICRFPDKHALVLYDEKSFVVINIPELEYNDFIKAVREVNPEIVYEQKSSPSKDDKKQ